MLSLFDKDHQLVRRYLQGDARAFDLLYDRHAPDVYHLLHRLASDKTRAEDLTQETLIAAFRSLAKWEQRGKFRSWLFGIAIRQYRHSLADRYNANAAPLEETLPDAAPDSDPLDYVTRQQAQALIEQAIGDLPPPYREVFVLRYVEGVKQQETAQILQLPLGTVQSRLWRAVRLLRVRLREWEYGVPESSAPAATDSAARTEEEAQHVMQFRA